MKLWLKRIGAALLLLLLLAIAINFQYFYVNVKFFLHRRPAALDERFVPALEGRQASMPANFLLIPSLGIQAPIVYVNENSDRAFSQALEKGVVHYPGTALPGEAGNCYLFGHSSDYPWKPGEYKTVLALLPQIAGGSELVVSGPQGHVFRYRVAKTLVAGPNQTEFLNQNNQQSKILTLQTSYPVGTALKRFIVIAELEK